MHEFYPKNDQTGMRFASTQLEDEFELVRDVL